MTSPRRGRGLHVAVELDGGGAHPEAGRSSAERVSPRTLADAVTEAERAGFTLVTFDDSPLPPGDGFRLDATTRAAYVATLTDRIGLAPTSHVATAEPFHLATQLASLDHATHGRAAWVAGMTGSAEALATVGRPALSPDALRQEVADVVEVVRQLWDSWEDDAVIKDVATGRYLDPDKVHHVDFEGAAFSVKGPLITPRPPQGGLVVLAPEDFADVVHPEIVLVSAPSLEELRDHARRARQSGAPLVFAELEVQLDSGGSTRAGRWAQTGRLRYKGSSPGLADLLGLLAADVDGVRLHPAVVATEVPRLAQEVLPALRRNGLHVPPDPGATLRETLSLATPTNRFAASARGSA